MGDRCFVSLYVLNESVDAVKEFPEFEESCEFYKGDFESRIDFSEVNYGQLAFAEKLATNGIPCYYRWERGDDYGPGYSYYYYDDQGKLLHKEVTDAGKNPDLNELLCIISEPRKLQAYIIDHANNVRPPIYNQRQIELGKKYLILKIINPEHA